jgi:hypothetical protein
MTSDGACQHIGDITTVKDAKRRVCEECVRTGDRWLYCYPDEAFAEYIEPRSALRSKTPQISSTVVKKAVPASSASAELQPPAGRDLGYDTGLRAAA